MKQKQRTGPTFSSGPPSLLSTPTRPFSPMAAAEVRESHSTGLSNAQADHLWTMQVKRARRGSYEFEDAPPIPAPTPSTPLSASPTRTRVLSNPSPSNITAPASAGPFRTSFNVRGVPVAGNGGYGGGTSGNTGHMRSASTSGSSPGVVFGSSGSLRGGPTGRPAHAGGGSPLGPYGAHARAPSLSSDIAASPFRSSFSPLNDSMPTPLLNSNGTAQQAPQSASSKPPQRHSRIHSRNLSIFFPRPGATAVPSIAEDGAQEIEAPVSSIPMGTTPSSHSKSSQSATFSTPPPPRSQLGGGFKFGGRPPQGQGSSSSIDQGLPDSASSSTDGGTPSSVPMSKVGSPASATQTTASRRGHHHRHSLSHSFFSFMEPGVSSHRRQPSSNLTAGMTSPSPASPPSLVISPSGDMSPNGSANGNPPQTAGWAPISPFPASATSAAFPPAQLLPPKRTAPFSPALPQPSTQRSSPLIQTVLALPVHMRYGLMFAVVEAAVGCGLWVLGSHYESLACSGLAYWVAFDAFGVGLGVYGRLVDAGAGGGSLRLPYG